MFIIETLSLYLHIINSETNLTTMKKQEMEKIIITELNYLWYQYEQFKNVLGEDHETTKRAAARWATIYELTIKLGL